MNKLQASNKINPLAVLTDCIPQFNKTIPSLFLKQETDELVHTAWMNGSIAKYEGLNLFCYRTDQRPFCTNPLIHLVQMNRDYTPIGKNFTLPVSTTKQGWRVDYSGMCNSGYQHRAEDPRIFQLGTSLVLFWTDGFKMYYGKLELILDKDSLIQEVRIINQFITRPPHVLELFQNPLYDGREKNWTPFGWNDELWIIYSMDPFICCKIIRGVIVETRKAECKLGKQWKHGFIKGGTPAIKITYDGKEQYLTIFHSTCKDKDDINYYYAGALVFDPETLEPTFISRYPLLAPYPDQDHKRPNSSYVIFPAGIVDEDGTYLFSYGYNDHSTKICAISKETLSYNLRPV